MARVGQLIQDGSVVWKVKDLRAVATTTENGLMSAYDKQKLDGIGENANNYTLPIASDEELGGVKIGTNITILNGVINVTDDNIKDALGYTPASQDVVTTTANGLMTKEDKSKLDNIQANANNYSLPTASTNTLGGVKIGDNVNINNNGSISIKLASSTDFGVVRTGSNITNTNGVININGDNITNALGYTPASTDVVTTTANGLMSKEDKQKLDGLSSSGSYTPTPASTNTPGIVKIGNNISVDNEGTISIPVATELAAGVMSAADKRKLDQITAGIIVVTPTQTNTLIYEEGVAQSPTWTIDDPDIVTITGITGNQVDAGTYNAIFTLAFGYCFPDRSTTKTVPWTIQPKDCEFELSKTEFKLSSQSNNRVIEVTGEFDGDIQISNYNTSVVTATVNQNNKTIALQYKGMGSTSFNVSIAAGQNYKASKGYIQVLISVADISDKLSENSLSTIKAQAIAGTASDWWDVGDMTAPVTLSGKISEGLTLNNYQARFFILGFNHNQSIETKSDGTMINSIHFQFGKSADGTTIAFCDDHFGEYYNAWEKEKGNEVFEAEGYFRHQTTQTYGSNVINYEASQVRITACQWFYNILPSEWRNAIVPVKKHSMKLAGVTEFRGTYETTDNIFLLDTLEVLSVSEIESGRATEHSQMYDYVKQYDFYKQNSCVKYRHDDPSTAFMVTKPCIIRVINVDSSEWSYFTFSELTRSPSGTAPFSRPNLFTTQVFLTYDSTTRQGGQYDATCDMAFAPAFVIGG